MAHLGLIGGIGPAATEWYYCGLTRGAARLGLDLDITISHARVADLVENAMAGRPDVQASIFREHMRRCQAAGADVGVVTSLAGHFCRKEFAAQSPLPLIDAVDALNAHFATAGIGRVGLLGSLPVVKSRVYGSLQGVETVIPEGDDLQLAHDTYVAMAMAGEVSEAQRATFFEIGQRMVDAGADAVMLSGTDLFLAFDGQDPGFAVIDGAEVHIAACLAVAAAG